MLCHFAPWCFFSTLQIWQIKHFCPRSCICPLSWRFQTKATKGSTSRTITSFKTQLRWWKQKFQLKSLKMSIEILLIVPVTQSMWTVADTIAKPECRYLNTPADRELHQWMTECEGNRNPNTGNFDTKWCVPRAKVNKYWEWLCSSREWTIKGQMVPRCQINCHSACPHNDRLLRCPG